MLPDFPYGRAGHTIVGADAASIFETLITSGKVRSNWPIRSRSRD